jgi:glyoxylase-like metal-dependent hydrolase (beta-lactamase superfamily II)
MAITRRALTAGASAVLMASQARAENKGAEEVKGPPVPDLPVTEISPHVVMIHARDGFPTPENQGMMANVIFVRGRDGIIVIDTGASVQIAEMAIRDLRKMTDKPVVGIINTHYHGDHWLGNHGFVEAFGDKLPIYALEGTRKAIEGGTGQSWRESMNRWTNQATAGTRIVAPNKDVKHGDTMSLGDVTLRLHHYGVAHTPDDLAVEIVEDGVMCVGDILMDRRIANMEEGSYKGTLETIDKLVANSKTKIWAPQHGVPGPNVVEWQRSLFQGIYEGCVQAVKDNVPLEGAAALVMKDPRVASKAKETAGWDRNIGKYISIAYLEAEQAQF